MKIERVRQIVLRHMDEIATKSIWFIWGGEYPWEVPLHMFNPFLEAMPAYDEGVVDGQLHIRLAGEEHDHDSPEWQQHLHDLELYERQRESQRKYKEKLRQESPEVLKEYSRRSAEKVSKRRKEVRDQVKAWVKANI